MYKMKNQNPHFVQVHKNLIVRCESVSRIFWDADDKKYLITIDGNIHKLDKKDGAILLNSIGVKPN